MFRNPFKRAAKAGGKGIMTEEEKAAAAKTAQDKQIKDAVDSALGAALNKALPTALADALKPFGEQIAALKPATPATPAKTDADAKPPTLEDFAKLIDTKLAASQTSQQQVADRQRFIGEKLKDVPAEFASALGNDPAKWPEQEQAVRTRYREVLSANGVKAPEVNGGANTANSATVAQTVDLSKMNPVQKIALGLKSLPQSTLGATGAQTVAANSPAKAAETAGAATAAK